MNLERPNKLVEKSSREPKAMAADGSNTDEDVKIFLEYMEKKIKYTSPFLYTIDRVLKPIRDVKPEDYTPRLISIGPLHHQEPHLIPMEAHKLRLVKEFLYRPFNKATLGDYLREMKGYEKEVRQCYSEKNPLNSDDFVRMMVVDGCFLLQLILGWTHYLNGDSIFNETWMPHIMRDLMLLENQLPFFVLNKLCKLCNGESRPDTIYDDTRNFIWNFLRLGQDVMLSRPDSETKHFLDYARHLYVSPFLHEHEQRFIRRKHSATELKKAAAVKFQKTNTRRFTDITFDGEDGKLNIPTIYIDNSTESLLRNLIALEQSHQYSVKYVTNYAIFMNDLINSPKDVKLLKKDGIFEGQVNPIEVADLYKNLLKEVTVPYDVCFSQVYHELESYYDSSWYRLGTIRHRCVSKICKMMKCVKTKYFDSPWSLIAFIAASTVLGLTMEPTIASFKSLKQKGVAAVSHETGVVE
ncbi:putative UPF0481 protein At3g02645 [Macadamia integrifolia]|uniref:putative UPF0481 protein At3g02645 n=1 Tax=Macadamia integrifolia TaxID=60698 RepID=UPI001C4E91D2|nr:putative UPF0481 protein At3g02645 [Macadamia integrifolia]